MAKRICSLDDCDLPYKGLGYCSKHYQRFKKNGHVELLPKWRVCAGPQCTRIVDAHQGTGLCKSHYKQRELGKPLTALRVATKDLGRPDTCTVSACYRPHKAYGYCKAHWDHVKAGREPRELQLRRPPGPCSLDDCHHPRLANGFCAKHNYTARGRWARYGLTPESGTALYELQDGLCASCGDPTPVLKMHVDHDHSCCDLKSGRGCGACVRGLLCRPCNLGIGQFADNPVRLRAAANYLERRAR